MASNEAFTEEVYAQYTWMVVLGGFFAFFTAFGIGANDVANSFATSVGSKALTIRKAMMIAAVFEFGGAVLLGNQVSDTIRSNISDPKCFADKPAVLMWGMCSVCLAVGFWLALASYLELPVSTTHSCVGGIVGMTLAAAGPKCVIWTKPSDEFPYVKGITSIVTSWFFSPIFSGIFAAFVFFVTRTFILRAPNSTQRAIQTYPIVVAFCTTMIAFYVVLKGASGINKMLKFDADGEGLGISCAISFSIGAFFTIASLLLKPAIKRMVEETQENQIDEDKRQAAEAAAIRVDIDKKVYSKTKTGVMGVTAWLSRALDTNIDEVVSGNEKTSAMHAVAEKFPPKTEAVFKYMQIITASFDAFAHGANDVANAMGPYTAVYYIHKTNGKFGKSNTVGLDMYWILALGGFGIVLGLGCYGYKIMFALGLKLAKITPSRGYSIELGSMFVVLLGSRFGIPLSTTHCQVGATVGVSLLEGNAKSTNWVLLGKTMAGWAFTMVVAGGLSATFASMGFAGIDWDKSQKIGKNWQ